MPSTRKISAEHASHRRLRVGQRTEASTTVIHRTATSPPLCTRVNAVASLVGVIPDETSLLNQRSEAFSRNYDRCTCCPTGGDARLVLYCGRCRHLFCERCMAQDKAGLWMCPRCARKAEKAPSVPSLWVEEPIEKQTARAQADAKESKGLVKVIRCKCGRGFNTVLGIGTVDCACGARFRLASAARIVATVQPKGRSVSARQGRVDALCRPS